MEKPFEILIECVPETFSSRTYRNNKFMIYFYLFLFLFITWVHGSVDDSMMTTYAFITILFYFDFRRRRNWRRFALIKLEANSERLFLKYQDKDSILEHFFNWEDINIESTTTLTKNPTIALIIKNKSEIVFQLYADTNREIDNEKIKLLSEELIQIIKSINPKCLQRLTKKT